MWVCPNHGIQSIATGQKCVMCRCALASYVPEADLRRLRDHLQPVVDKWDNLADDTPTIVLAGLYIKTIEAVKAALDSTHEGGGE